MVVNFRIACLVTSFITVVVITAADARRTLTNIDFLGLGYNILTGNPHADLRDPGFLEPVIALDYKEDASTADGKWKVPDKVSVQHTVSCLYEAETSEVHGTTAYHNTLSKDVSVSGGGWRNRFSASTAFTEVRNGTSMYRKAYMTSVARCLTYRASFRQFAPVRLSPEFVYAVNSLPIEQVISRRTEKFYFEFISAFGTHYANALEMGAKAVVRNEFDQVSWSKMVDSKLDIRLAARVSFFMFSFKTSAGRNQHRHLAETFDRQRVSYKASYLGSRPPADGLWETWAHSSDVSPYPIGYELRPITDLLTPRYFPNIDQAQLAIKARLLNDSYAAYCRGLSGCMPPGPDRLPVRMERIDTAFIGVQRVSCRHGDNVLSCGLDNLPNTPQEHFRRAIPASVTSCECYDSFSARCIVWCTNAVPTYYMLSTVLGGVSSRVNCRQGAKVLGCHIAPNSSRADTLRSHYPNDDGNGCVCHGNQGALCIATCATNIVHHEVVSQYGRGVTTVFCPTSSFVLGCGIRTSGNAADGWRTHHVTNSTDGCQCYDRNGATCYATCGNFGNSAPYENW